MIKRIRQFLNFTLISVLFVTLPSCSRNSVDAVVVSKITAQLHEAASRVGARDRSFDLSSINVVSVNRTIKTLIFYPKSESNNYASELEVHDFECVDEAWLETEQGRKDSPERCRTEYKYEVKFKITGPKGAAFDNAALSYWNPDQRDLRSERTEIVGEATLIQKFAYQFRSVSLRQPAEAIDGGEWEVTNIRAPSH